MTHEEIMQHIKDLDKRIYGPKKIGDKMDKLIEDIINLPEPIIDYGPNVLQFDQNKRKKHLVNRIHKNNAKVLQFKRSNYV